MAGHAPAAMLASVGQPGPTRHQYRTGVCMSSRGRSQLRAAGRTQSSFNQSSSSNRPVRHRIGVLAAIAGIVAASLTFVVAPARALAAGNAVVPNSAFTNFTDVAMQPSDDGSWPDDSNPQVFPFAFNI